MWAEQESLRDVIDGLSQDEEISLVEDVLRKALLEQKLQGEAEEEKKELEQLEEEFLDDEDLREADDDMPEDEDEFLDDEELRELEKEMDEDEEEFLDEEELRENEEQMELAEKEEMELSEEQFLDEGLLAENDAVTTDAPSYSKNINHTFTVCHVASYTYAGFVDKIYTIHCDTSLVIMSCCAEILRCVCSRG